MKLVQKKVALVTGGILAMALIAAPSAQAATKMSICSNKTTGSLSIKAKCSAKENRLRSLSQLVGAAGANGANGLAGAAGAAGVNGTNGVNGINGAAGTNGANGANGLVGPAGVGLTQASFGLACSVDEDGAGAIDVLPGTFTWEETVTPGNYTLVCDTTP